MQYVTLRELYNGVPVNVFSLSSRALNSLERAGITNLAQVAELDMKTIKSYRGIGDKALNEILSLRRRALASPQHQIDFYPFFEYLKSQLSQGNDISYEEIIKFDLEILFDIYLKEGKSIIKRHVYSSLQDNIDIHELLDYLKVQIPEWKDNSYEDLVKFDVKEILPVYFTNTKKIISIAKIASYTLPAIGTPYPLLNILTSIARTEECITGRHLINYLFRDFSELERKVLFMNFDGQQRCFASFGRELDPPIKRERARQIYWSAFKRWETPYQRQKQAGLYLKLLCAVYQFWGSDPNNLINSIIRVIKNDYRGSKKHLDNVIMLVLMRKLE